MGRESPNRCVIAFSAILAVVAVSCTVLEDRRFCPFALTVDLALSPRPPVQCECAEVAVCNDKGEITASISFSEDERGWHDFDLERGRFRVCGVFNRKDGMMDIPARRIMIPYGMQSDSIYAFSYSFDFEKEKMILYPMFYKQWATAMLIAGNGTGGNEFFENFEVVVLSDTEGLDLMTLEGVKGRFSYSLSSTSDRASVRLPRQRGNALELSIRERNTGGQVLRYSLSAQLEKMGYDWNAPNLEDFCLVISEMADCSLQLDVKQWNGYEMGQIQL